TSCAGTPTGTNDYYENGVFSGVLIDQVTAANGAFWYKGPVPLRFASISDGLTNTLFFGEKHVQLKMLGKEGSVFNGDYGNSFKKAGVGAALVRNPSATSGQFGSWHPGVCQFTLGDGSVKAIRNEIDV